MGSQTPPHTFPPAPPLETWDAHDVTLELPSTDNRPHRYFVLPNGIEAVVVSDVNADKAAASISVEAGSMNDPEDLPGCAHFCEHLVLISSKNFPEEDGYKAFLGANGGSRSAGTGQVSTTYWFDVAPRGLKEGLERTADLILNPLFPTSQVDREVNSIEAEYKMDIPSDSHRKYQILYTLAKPGHRLNHFNIGNIETLVTLPERDGRSPRDELVDWHAANYCGRRIKVAVLGREDVDTLQSWVTRLFSDARISTQGLPLTGPNAVFRSFDIPFGPEGLGKVVFYQSVKERRNINIHIPIPDVRHLYRTKPFSFIAGLLGYEGNGSILASLKERGWATGLSTWIDDRTRGYALLGLNISLTPDGLKHWSEASALVFDYLRLLRQQSHDLKQVFEDRQQLSNVKFRYRQPRDSLVHVKHLVYRLRYPVPRSKILSSATTFEEYNSSFINTALEHLQIENAIVFLESQELPAKGPPAFTSTEPIFGGRFTVDSLQKLVQLGDTIDPTLHLPHPNPFIPRDFDLTPPETVSEAPLLLSDTAHSRLWYKNDTTFLLPKSEIRIKLQSPLINASPRGAALSALLIELTDHAFSTEEGDATLAGFSYTAGAVHDTLRFRISGFTDKLDFFVGRIIFTLLNFALDTTTFGNVVDQLKRDLKNELFEPPYLVVYREAPKLLVETYWSQEELIQELDNVTLTEAVAFRTELLARLHIETLVYGGISEEGAIKLHSDIQKALSSAALTPSEKGGPPRWLLLPEGYEGTKEFTYGNSEEPSNGIGYILYAPTGVEDRTTRLTATLVLQVARAPFSSILRTQEQLGYAVKLYPSVEEGSLVRFKAYIQSDREPAFVESRISHFFDIKLGDILRDLSDDDFAKYVQSVVDELEEKPTSPTEEAARIWQAIVDGRYEFDRRATDAAHLRTITKADAVDFYDRYLNSSSKTRRKLVVYLRSQKTAPTEVKSGEKIGDVATFKQGLVAGKRALPVKPWAEYAKGS